MLAFDVINGIEDLAAFSVSKESSSREKRKRRVFRCRRTVRVKVKANPMSFLKIEGRGCLSRQKHREKSNS